MRVSFCQLNTTRVSWEEGPVEALPPSVRSTLGWERIMTRLIDQAAVSTNGRGNVQHQPHIRSAFHSRTFTMCGHL